MWASGKLGKRNAGLVHLNCTAPGTTLMGRSVSGIIGVR